MQEHIFCLVLLLYLPTYVLQNSSLGSPVFRVVASDPDDPNSHEGQLKYSFLQDGSDSLAFKIGKSFKSKNKDLCYVLFIPEKINHVFSQFYSLYCPRGDNKQICYSFIIEQLTSWQCRLVNFISQL